MLLEAPPLVWQKLPSESLKFVIASIMDLPFLTYTADELNALSGTFSGSAFVRETTGVDCVSERAAVRASGGELVVGKIAEDGMTFALARFTEELSYE